VKLTRLLLASFIFCLGVVAGLYAQELMDTPQRVEKNRAVLSGAETMEVIASVSEYKPGERIGLHFHHGVEAAYVIQGASVQAPGQEPRSIPAGATQMNLRDIRHGGFTVVGDQSLKLYTVHVVDRDKPLYDYAP
jgi:quercetin dioxygenase-like cupin family protein